MQAHWARCRGEVQREGHKHYSQTGWEELLSPAALLAAFARTANFPEPQFTHQSNGGEQSSLATPQHMTGQGSKVELPDPVFTPATRTPKEASGVLCGCLLQPCLNAALLPEAPSSTCQFPPRYVVFRSCNGIAGTNYGSAFLCPACRATSNEAK